MQETVTIQYVNPRNGKKPASIKTSDGRYFTVDDFALPMFQQGATIALGYEQNQSGFLIARTLNGQPLPVSSRRPVAQATPMQQPVAQPMQQPMQQPVAQPQAPASNGGGITLARAQVAAACIQAGLGVDVAAQWWQWVTAQNATATTAGTAPF